MKLWEGAGAFAPDNKVWRDPARLFPRTNIQRKLGGRDSEP